MHLSFNFQNGTLFFQIWFSPWHIRKSKQPPFNSNCNGQKIQEFGLKRQYISQWAHQHYQLGPVNHIYQIRQVFSMLEIFLQWAHFTSHWVFYSNCRGHLSNSESVNHQALHANVGQWSLESIQFSFRALLSVYRRERWKMYSKGRMVRSCIKQNLLIKSRRDVYYCE